LARIAERQCQRVAKCRDEAATRKDCYAQLEAANNTLDIEPWLDWFANLVLAAQARTADTRRS